MLVLLGPPFQGTDDEYATLASTTGLLGYDLKTKLKPNTWGVVRAIADAEQANELGSALRAQGFRVSVVDPQVASDPERIFVLLRALSIEEEGLVLHLSERAMPIPFRAMCAIVRGEVQIGTKPRARPSSTSFRVPTAAEIEVFRESLPTSQFDAFAALDLHFKTVLWVARIDVRAFDFSVLPDATGTAQDLDRLADQLAERARLRVDRAGRVSSLASFASGGPGRATTPLPSGPVSPPRTRETPERFDAYSRLVAEAERQAMRLARLSTRPPPPV